MKKSIVFCLLFFALSASNAQDYSVELLPVQTEASFRALSVVDDNIAWIAGTNGTIGRTTDGASTWSFSTVNGYEKFDFRSLYAFDGENAVVANAGSPANILITGDGGLSWTNVYHNPDTAAFLDGVDFWDRKNGIVYGDPLNGKLLVLQTRDGGNSWISIPESSRPMVKVGEASFAASGTNIRCLQKGHLAIATGGTTSRLFYSDNMGQSWMIMTPPILQGKPSAGIFSFCFYGKGRGVVAGGDYLADTLKIKHVYYTKDNGKTWLFPDTPTRGYRECVEHLGSETLIVTGPTGTEITSDGGANWRAVSDEKFFHVVRKARRGNLVLIAGGKGKIGIVKKR